MHIFCRETRAHLELHPHLPDDVTAGSAAAGLITPDLWLKNCKSPEPPSSSPPMSPKIGDNLPQTSPLPLITVAHPSKFMDNPETNKRQRSKVQKKNRKRCSATVTCSPTNKSPPIAEIPQDLRVRHTPPVGSFESLQFRDDQRTTNIYNRNFVDPFRGPHSHLFNGFPSPHSKFFNQPQLPPPPQPPPLPSLNNVLPPVTVLVPYPIIIPLPLPIPIPIPIPCDSKSKLDDVINKDVKNSPTVPTTAPSQNGNSSLLDAENTDTKTSDEKENVNEKSEKQDGETNNYVEVNGTGKPFRKRKRLAMENKGKIGNSVKNKKSVPV